MGSSVHRLLILPVLPILCGIATRSPSQSGIQALGGLGEVDEAEHCRDCWLK